MPSTVSATDGDGPSTVHPQTSKVTVGQWRISMFMSHHVLQTGCVARKSLFVPFSQVTPSMHRGKPGDVISRATECSFSAAASRTFFGRDMFVPGTRPSQVAAFAVAASASHTNHWACMPRFGGRATRRSQGTSLTVQDTQIKRDVICLCLKKRIFPFKIA